MSSTLTYFNPISGQMEQEKGIGNHNYNKYWATSKTNEMNYVLNERNNQLQQDLANQANTFTQSERIAQNEWNREQELDARAFNIQMRDEQREYDLPEAQMQRAIQAGINPNLVAQGLGGSSGGSTSDVQGSPAQGASNSQGQMANVNPAQMENPRPDSVTFFDKLLQGVGAISSVIKDTSQSAQNFQISKYLPETIRTDMELKTAQKNASLGLMDYYMTMTSHYGANAVSDREFKFAQKRVYDTLNDWYTTQKEQDDETLKEFRANMEKRKEQLDLSIKSLQQAVKNQQEEFKEIQSRTALNSASARQANANASYIESQTPTLDEATLQRKTELDNAVKIAEATLLGQLDQLDPATAKIIVDFFKNNPNATYDQLMDEISSKNAPVGGRQLRNNLQKSLLDTIGDIVTSYSPAGMFKRSPISKLLGF